MLLRKMQKPFHNAQKPGRSHTLAAPGAQAWVQEMAPGFLVSANSQTANQHHHRSVSQPGMRVIMLLEGELSLRFDQQDFHLRSTGNRSSPILVLNNREEILFERLGASSGRETKICMSISDDWLAQHGLLEWGAEWQAQTRKAPLQHVACRGDQPLRNLGCALLRHAASNPLLSTLEREILAMQLLGKVIEQLQPVRAVSGTRPGNRLHKVKCLLESGEASDWSISHLAELACMSTSTLQRYFKREYGCSVMDYVRGLRLDKAREDLARGKGNITSIALDAGYNSPANFSTAFRRRFGSAPRDSLGLYTHDTVDHAD
jgi:AraC-like DNA-binding protein